MGGEPFAYIQRSGGSETVAELTMLIAGGETYGNTAFSLDEPVALEVVEEYALRGILNIGNFLSVLCNSCACEQGKA